VSAAAVWEIAIKCALGRIDFPLERLDAILASAPSDPRTRCYRDGATLVGGMRQPRRRR
jgi:hypothetical protein